MLTMALGIERSLYWARIPLADRFQRLSDCFCSLFACLKFVPLRFASAETGTVHIVHRAGAILVAVS